MHLGTSTGKLDQCYIFTASSADGLAWDWVNRNLYWTDAEDKDIEVIDPLSTHRKLLISTGSSSMPRAIVVDPQKR